MSNGAAIQTGEAFVRFFGDMRDINKAMDDIAARGRQWATKFTAPKVAVDSVTVAVQNSGAVAEQFSAKANAALSQTNAQFSATSAAAGQTAVAVQAVGSSANTMGSITSSALTPQVANFIRLGLAAISAGANLSRMLYPIGKLAGLVGYVGLTTLNVGKLGRAAGIAATLLGHISSELRAAGLSTTSLDRITMGLTKIGQRARYLGIITRVAFAPYRAAWSLGGMAARGAMSLGGMAFSGARSGIGMMTSGGGGRLARGAALANIGAMSSGTGENGETTGAAVASGLLSGFALGGPAGAALVGLGVAAASMFKKAWKDSMKTGGDASGGFLAQAVYKVRQYGQWVSTTLDSVSKRLSAMFKSTGEGESVFAKLEKAVYPIVYAIESVWIPAFFSGLEKVKAFFSAGTSEMKTTWMDWIVGTIGMVADFVGNFDLYWQLAQQTIVMWAGNGILLVSDFFSNFGTWMSWLGKNWSRVLLDMFDYSATIFINIGQNLRTVFEKIWTWVKSGFTTELVFTKDDFKGLTEGYRSSLGDMPAIFRTELAATTPEIERIRKDLKSRQMAADEAFKPMDPVKLKSNFTSVSALNSFAAARLGATGSGPLDKIAKATDQTAENTKKIANNKGLVLGS